MIIAPSGHLYTHDIEESRVKDIESEFKVYCNYWCVWLGLLSICNFNSVVIGPWVARCYDMCT